MQLNPNVYLLSTTAMTFIVALFCAMFGPIDLCYGVLVSSAVLTVNLWGCIWYSRTFIEVVTNYQSPWLLKLFSFLKFIVLATTLIALYLIVGGTPLLISNSIVVNALIFTSLFYALSEGRGLSNECS